MVKLNAKIIFSVSSKTLCFIGCIYQMIQINGIYFSYQTSTDIKYQEDNIFEQPSITLCYVKVDQLKDEYINRLPRSNIYNQLNFLNNFTIGEQFEYLENYPRCLNSCLVHDNIQGMKSCQVYNQTKFSSLLYCFTIYSESEENIVIKDKKSYLIIKMNRSGNKSMTKSGFVNIRLHDIHFNSNTTEEKESIFLDINNDFTLIKYWKTRVVYKFTPKDRYCFRRGDNRIKCMNVCEKNAFIKLFNKYPDTSFATKMFSELKFSTSFENFSSDKNCLKNCELGVGCYKETFFAQTHNFNKQESDHSLYGLYFKYPTHPTTIYEISLKMQFEEYTYVLSQVFSAFGSVSLFFG